MEENYILRFFAKITFSVGISYLAWKLFEKMSPGYGPIGLLLTSMIWVRFFPRDILSLFSWIKRQAYHSAVFHWHGKYYSFDGRQIRFYLIEQTVWIPVVDLERILEPKIAKHELKMLLDLYGEIPGHKLLGVTEAGLLGLLKTRTEGGHTNYKMIRFKRWLLTSALENIKRLPCSAIKQIK
jgi:hypothetical protein